MLNFSQVEIFRRLLTHILDEKIISATSLKQQKGSKSFVQSEIKEPIIQKEPFQEIKKKPNLKNNGSLTEIYGEIIAKTEKALNIKFNETQEIWIPRSTIHCEFIDGTPQKQKFMIDSWVLKKNSVVA
ncbi:MAG: hypothetical protein ACTSR8_19795 [Promethearchaeota archaeon]